MSDELDIQLDDFYFFAASLAAVSGFGPGLIKNSPINQSACLPRGIEHLLTDLFDIPFDYRYLPNDSFQTLDAVVKRNQMLQVLVVRSTQQIFGLDPQTALQELAERYDARDGITLSDVQTVFGYAVDIASLILLVIAVLDPIPGDEAAVMLSLAGRITTNASMFKHTWKFLQSDKSKLGSWETFGMNVVLAYVWKNALLDKDGKIARFLEGKGPVGQALLQRLTGTSLSAWLNSGVQYQQQTIIQILLGSNLNLTAQAWDKLQITGLWEIFTDAAASFSDAKPSNIESKVTQIIGIFHKSGVELTDQQVRDMIANMNGLLATKIEFTPDELTTMMDLGDVKLSDAEIQIVLGGSLLAPDQQKTIPLETDYNHDGKISETERFRSWFQTAKEEKGVPNLAGFNGPIKNGVEFQRFWNEFQLSDIGSRHPGGSTFDDIMKTVGGSNDFDDWFKEKYPSSSLAYIDRYAELNGGPYKTRLDEYFHDRGLNYNDINKLLGWN